LIQDVLLKGSQKTQMQNWRAIFIPSLIWLGVIAAALIAALLRGLSLDDLMGPALLLAFPAVIGMALSAIIQKEWAQILLILIWLAVAIATCLFIGFYPLGILFLAAPVIASLFKREKIVEALIIAVIFAALLYYASVKEVVPESPLDADQKLWAYQAGIMSLIALVISTLFIKTNIDAPVVRTSAKTDMAEHIQHLDQSALFNSVNGSLMQFSRSGALTQANEEARRKFHFNALGMTTLNSVLANNSLEQERFTSALKTMLKTKKPQFLRLSVPDPDHDMKHHILDTQIMPYEEGGIVVHAIDRSEAEQALETLRAEQKAMAAKPDEKTLFFAGVSHELRTPLNAIIGFSDMMRSRLFGPLPSKYAEYADLIHDSGQHMLDLIGDVLDLSKVEVGKYSLQYDTFDAADVMRSSVKMLRPAADAADVKLDMDINHDDSLLVEADRKAVRQILLNLLSNAVKFSNKGGTVRVSAGHKHNYLLLCVEDNGDGISVEDLKTIGTPFTQSATGLTSDERGSGLGLSLVKSLTELHEGQFDIQSEVGRGTKVTVALPWSRPSQN
jgi:cell cycle sensor histidine kinase DivJ